MNYKRAQGTFVGNKNVLYLNFSNAYTNIDIYKNSSNCKLKKVQFYNMYIILNKVD